MNDQTQTPVAAINATKIAMATRPPAVSTSRMRRNCRRARSACAGVRAKPMTPLTCVGSTPRALESTSASRSNSAAFHDAIRRVANSAVIARNKPMAHINAIVR